MTKVMFETAGLADALKEAGAIAPNRGEAFDKAAGIVLDVQREQVVVMATDLRLQYMQWVTPLAVDGPPVKWRLPAKVFVDVVTKLPMTSSTRLALQQQGNIIKFTHGKKRGQFNLIDIDAYPFWMPFDPDGLTEVPDMATRIGQVEWAASTKTNVPFTGVHFTGEIVVATDRYKFATAPLKIADLAEPVTVPARMLNSIIKPTDLVMLRATENELLLMPDQHTQVRSVIYGVEYPNISGITKRERPVYVKVQKAMLLDTMQITSSFIASERVPTMRFFFGQEEIAVMMANQEVGHLGDVLDVPGQATHPRVEIKFDPKNIMDALEHCATQEVTLGYDPGRPAGALYINAGEGCEFWIAPKKDVISDAE